MPRAAQIEELKSTVETLKQGAAPGPEPPWRMPQELPPPPANWPAAVPAADAIDTSPGLAASSATEPHPEPVAAATEPHSEPVAAATEPHSEPVTATETTTVVAAARTVPAEQTGRVHVADVAATAPSTEPAPAVPPPPAEWQSTSLRWCNSCGKKAYYKKGWCNNCGWAKKKPDWEQKDQPKKWKKAKPRQDWRATGSRPDEAAVPDNDARPDNEARPENEARPANVSRAETASTRTPIHAKPPGMPGFGQILVPSSKARPVKEWKKEKPWTPKKAWTSKKAWGTATEQETLPAVGSTSLPAVGSTEMHPEPVIEVPDDSEAPQSLPAVGSNETHPEGAHTVAEAGQDGASTQMPSKDMICSICQQHLSTFVGFWLPCCHCFHVFCIKKWWDYKQAMTCPICKHDCKEAVHTWRNKKWLEDVADATFPDGSSFLTSNGGTPDEGLQNHWEVIGSDLTSTSTGGPEQSTSTSSVGGEPMVSADSAASASILGPEQSTSTSSVGGEPMVSAGAAASAADATSTVAAPETLVEPTSAVEPTIPSTTSAETGLVIATGHGEMSEKSTSPDSKTKTRYKSKQPEK